MVPFKPAPCTNERPVSVHQSALGAFVAKAVYCLLNHLSLAYCKYVTTKLQIIIIITLTIMHAIFRLQWFIFNHHSPCFAT